MAPRERDRSQRSGSGILKTEAVTRLQACPPTLIVLEATGSLEVPLAGALTAVGLPVVVVNPRQVRDFARATRQEAS